MVRRLGNNWQRTVAILATILAILFSPLPFSSLNAAFTASHITILAEYDHDHLEQRPVAPHFVNSPAQHRHGHSSADHSHDLPTGITAVANAEFAARTAWRFALSSAVVSNQPTAIERPPKASATA